MLIALIILVSFGAACQNNFGSLHSNYTPTNSLYINPSSILDAKVWLDINLVGAGSYTNNNLVYLKDQRWMDVVRDAKRGTTDLTEDDLGYDQGRNKYHAYNRSFVATLAGVWSQGDHAIGLSTGARSFTDVRRVPDYVAYFIEHGVPAYTVQHDIEYHLKNLRAASTSFGEIKGTYAYTFLKRRRDMFMAGISVSRFFPIAGAGANVYDFDFLVDNDSLALLYHLESDLMYTPDPKFYSKGGWGLDLGFTYQKMLGEAGSYYPNSPKLGCREVPYLYKIGISVMDLGYVKFPEDEILFAGYNFDNYDWLNYPDDEFNEDNATDIYAEIEPAIDEGRVKKPYKMSLPTFVSAQFDYNAWASRIYLNATIVQGIPAGKNKFGVRHANSLSFTPRYESFFFDFALPMSLYEYRYPQIGASVRLGPITLGTDKLFSWISKTNLYGADIYFHLKLPFRYHPKCKGRFKGVKSKNGERHKKYRPCEAYG